MTEPEASKKKAPKKEDIEPMPITSLNWEPAAVSKSIDELFLLVTAGARKAIDWYIAAKRPKRRYARLFRVLVILLGATAALLPTIGELLPQLAIAGGGAVSHIPAGWTIVLLGMAGVLLLLDRFFGFSNAWVRYVTTELKLTQLCDEFQIKYEAEKASWKSAPPDPSQIAQVLAKCMAFMNEVHGIVLAETQTWVQEFESAIREIDESSKLRSAAAELGALNVVIANPASAPSGWTLQIDRGTPEIYAGASAAVRNLVPGAHTVTVEAENAGKTYRAERIASIPPGGVHEAILTLA